MRNTAAVGSSAVSVIPGDSWRFFKGRTAPPASWNTRTFDDSTWASGRSGFGYGDRDDATLLSDMQGSYVSVYLRRAFSIADPSQVATLSLSMDFDDGFVAYLNGTEVARVNVAGIPPAYNARATADHEASAGCRCTATRTSDLSAFRHLLVAGTNVLAVEGHNVGISSSDLTLIPALKGTEVAVVPNTPTPTPTMTPAPSTSIPIALGDSWRFFKGRTAPPSTWNARTFDDSVWASGRSGFGYGDGDDATLLSDMQGSYVSVYLRRAFSIADPSQVVTLSLSMDFDDGFVAYLNGTEVARVNVAGTPPAYNARATGDHEASAGCRCTATRTFDLSAFRHLLVAGTNVLAVEGHNVGISSSDLTLIPTLGGKVGALLPATPTATPSATPPSSPTPTAIPPSSPTPVPTPTQTPSPVPPSQPTPVGQSGTWTLAFRDEFDGTSLDRTKWVPCFPWGTDRGCGSTTTPELWYLPQNVIVSDGTLKLRALQQAVTGTDGKAYKYTSGIVTTAKLYGETGSYREMFKYGYMEMRAKMPKGKGLWPAFWTLPPEGKWPPEIDVIEVLGHDTTRAHLHYHYEDSSGTHRDSGGSWVGPDFAADFHTFAVSWTPEAIHWYIDGVERRTPFTDKASIAAEPMYLLLNLQVGGSWPGSPDSTTPFPSDYEVDYVRVWTP